jgi:hypothetical protein
MNVIKNFFFLDKYLKVYISLIIFIYFFCAVVISRDLFSNHVLLIFTEAKQFLDSKKIYKEIHVLYGIGQPLFNGLSLYLFGENVFSIQLNVNIFYFLSIFVFFLIFLKINSNFFDCLFIILILLNIHPIPIYPWSNYLAFLPVILSLFFLLKKKNINFFLSGFFLALACLNRETILLSAIIIFFYVIYENLFHDKNLSLIKYYLLGFFTVFITFFSYMFFSSNYLIWIELIYPLSKWQSLINLGYYINTDITFLRKIYIYFFAPFRELFLTFIKSIYNFWPVWILIFISYFLCCSVLIKRIFLNKSWLENKSTKYNVSIISVYSLSLIIQNLHFVELNRVATGSIVGLIILSYFFIKIVINKKIRIFFYLLLLLQLLLSQSKVYHDKSLKNLYELIFYKINNFNLYNKYPDDFKKIKEFQYMNYNNSVHEFYSTITEICDVLRNKNGIKYSDNQTPFWELSYFCKTQPKYYYALTSHFLEENFKKSQFKGIYNSNTHNTVEFYVGDEINLKEIDYFDSRGFIQKKKLKNFKILYIFDLKFKYPDLYKDYKKRYLFIAQKKS